MRGEGHAFDPSTANSEIDFREVVCCLSVLTRGSTEERLRLLFDIFDADDSGFLEGEEIAALAGAGGRCHERRARGTGGSLPSQGEARESFLDCNKDIYAQHSLHRQNRGSTRAPPSHYTCLRYHTSRSN